MARTMAPADPNTLAAALMDQAQRIEGAWMCSRRRRPLGNGTPIRNAPGAMQIAVMATLADIGQPAAAAATGAAANAIPAIRIATAPRIHIRRRSLPRTRRRRKELPTPLAASIENTITVRA